MKISDLKVNSKKRKKRVRIGRGPGSGFGKTAGYGHKGQRARSGGAKAPWFEGGQNRLTTRLPKVGFTNPFPTDYQIVNIGFLNEKFESGAEINMKILFDKGYIKSIRGLLKILGNGEIKKSFKVTADKLSKSAVEKIKNAGGEVILK